MSSNEATKIKDATSPTILQYCFAGIILGASGTSRSDLYVAQIFLPVFLTDCCFLFSFHPSSSGVDLIYQKDIANVEANGAH